MTAYYHSRSQVKKIPMRIPFNADEVYVHFSSECSGPLRIRLLENQSPAYPDRSFFEQKHRQTVLFPALGDTCLFGRNPRRHDAESFHPACRKKNSHCAELLSPDPTNGENCLPRRPAKNFENGPAGLFRPGCRQVLHRLCQSKCERSCRADSRGKIRADQCTQGIRVMNPSMAPRAAEPWLERISRE